MRDFDLFTKIDKTAISVSTLYNEIDDKDYWLSKSSEERLKAVELIRQTLYGYSFSTAGFQRILEIAELTAS